MKAPLIPSSLFSAIMGHLGWQSHIYSIIQNRIGLQYHYVVKIYLTTVSQGVGNCELCSWLRRGPVMKKWSVLEFFSQCIIHGITSTHTLPSMHTCPVLAKIARKSTSFNSPACTLEELPQKTQNKSNKTNIAMSQYNITMESFEYCGQWFLNSKHTHTGSESVWADVGYAIPPAVQMELQITGLLYVY